MYVANFLYGLQQFLLIVPPLTYFNYYKIIMLLVHKFKMHTEWAQWFHNASFPQPRQLELLQLAFTNSNTDSLCT